MTTTQPPKRQTKTHTIIAALAAAGLIAGTAGTAAAGPLDSLAPGSAAGSAAVDTVLPDGALYNDPAADPFYQPPASVPGPGTIIRTQPADHLLALTGLQWPGHAEKILYGTTNVRGEAVAVSGVVFEPTTKWEGNGPTPTVVVAPGTMGQGRQCAPSLGKGMFLNFNPGIPTLGTDYELLSVYGALLKGMRVVMTDYIGMGTPGLHTYVNSADEGHAVLDAGRAALNHFGAPADSPIGMMGYSQGGGAAASAAELAATYAPDLNIRATYAGAPPADLREVLKQIDGTLITGAIGYALNSGLHYNPQLAHLLDTKLNDKGRTFLKDVANQCIVDTAATYGLSSTSEFTSNGESFSTLLEELPEVGAFMDEQRLGQPGRVPNHPIRIDNSSADDVIPWGQSRQLAVDYCEQGGNVQYDKHDYPEVVPRSAIGHAVPMVLNQQKSLEYLTDAFNGTPQAGNCGSF